MKEAKTKKPDVKTRDPERRKPREARNMLIRSYQMERHKKTIRQQEAVKSSAVIILIAGIGGGAILMLLLWVS